MLVKGVTGIIKQVHLVTNSSAFHFNYRVCIYDVIITFPIGNIQLMSFRQIYKTAWFCYNLFHEYLMDIFVCF